ncbi:MAG TPA: hypothetical protein GX525_05915 [Bacilli bacterium]|nr:hypothetical protein [Bacilli bacterium]
MKEFNQTIEIYEAYYQALKNSDQAYGAAAEEIKQYNANLAEEKGKDLLREHRGSVAALRHIYNEKLNAVLEAVKAIVGGAFTQSLSAEDEATLSNLEKLTLSDSERELYLEKYKKARW